MASPQIILGGEEREVFQHGTVDEFLTSTVEGQR